MISLGSWKLREKQRSKDSELQQKEYEQKSRKLFCILLVFNTGKQINVSTLEGLHFHCYKMSFPFLFQPHVHCLGRYVWILLCPGSLKSVSLRQNKCSQIVISRDKEHLIVFFVYCLGQYYGSENFLWFTVVRISCDFYFFRVNSGY